MFKFRGLKSFAPFREEDDPGDRRESSISISMWNLRVVDFSLCIGATDEVMGFEGGGVGDARPGEVGEGDAGLVGPVSSVGDSGLRRHTLGEEGDIGLGEARPGEMGPPSGDMVGAAA